MRARQFAHKELAAALAMMRESTDVAADSIRMAVDEVVSERGRLGARVVQVRHVRGATDEWV